MFVIRFAPSDRKPRVAHEVLKRVGGREYVYRVDASRDVGTGRMRRVWTYVGRFDGTTVRRARPRKPESPRERILAAILQLIETRDVAFVTVDVVTRAADLSRTTFYRHFADRESALAAAYALLVEDVLGKLPPLDVVKRGAHRACLRAWLESLLASLSARPGLTRRVVLGDRRWRDGLLAVLESYLGKLRDARVVLGEAPRTLASGLVYVLDGLLARTLREPGEALDDACIADVVRIAERLVFGAQPSGARSTR